MPQFSEVNVGLRNFPIKNRAKAYALRSVFFYIFKKLLFVEVKTVCHPYFEVAWKSK